MVPSAGCRAASIGSPVVTEEEGAGRGNDTSPPGVFPKPNPGSDERRNLLLSDLAEDRDLVQHFAARV
jgi:hypothetical protein